MGIGQENRASAEREREIVRMRQEALTTGAQLIIFHTLREGEHSQEKTGKTQPTTSMPPRSSVECLTVRHDRKQNIIEQGGVL